jgi:hypothetical protein
MSITSVNPGRIYFSMTPQAMLVPKFPAELQIHETAEYWVNALQSIAKPRLSSAPLMGGSPAGQFRRSSRPGQSDELE